MLKSPIKSPNALTLGHFHERLYHAQLLEAWLSLHFGFNRVKWLYIFYIYHLFILSHFKSYILVFLKITCPTITFVEPNIKPIVRPIAPSFIQWVRFSLWVILESFFRRCFYFYFQ